MEPDRLRRAVTAQDQTAGVVAEELGRHATEVLKCRRDPIEPLALTLVEERLHEELALGHLARAVDA